MALRQATEADRAFVAHVEEVCIRDYAIALWGTWRPPPAEEFEAAQHRIIVHRGVDAGCIATVRQLDHLWLDKLYLLPDHRRQGLGAAVLHVTIEDAKRLGLPLRLSVLTTNPAQAFYRREGLHVLGQDKERVTFGTDPPGGRPACGPEANPIRVANGAVLRGLRVLLRRPRPEDVSERLALGRDPEIMRMFGADPAGLPPLTEAGAARWVQGLTEHPHAWMVEHEGRQLGEVRLDGADPHDKRARLAIGFYDPGRLGMGLGREAVRLVLGYAFGPLGLHRVGLRVVAYNERAIRCYRACGFVEEGREREAALVGTERHDDVMMGVLAREFLHSRGASSA